MNAVGSTVGLIASRSSRLNLGITECVLRAELQAAVASESCWVPMLRLNWTRLICINRPMADPLKCGSSGGGTR